MKVIARFVDVRCPICKKLGRIKLNSNNRKTSGRGLFAVDVLKGIVCEHAFITYIDRNFMVRDTFTADFLVSVPENNNQQYHEIENVNKEFLDISLIKLNIPKVTLAYMLKAMFYKKKIAFILEDCSLYDHILNFFRYLTKNSFIIDISMMSIEDYTPYINLTEDYVVINQDKVIRDKNHILIIKKNSEEMRMAENFLSEKNLITSSIVLKNEITKAYIYSLKIVEYLENYKNLRSKSFKNLMKYLHRKHKISIKTNYLEFLLKIVENYFGVEIPEVMKQNQNIISLL